MCLVKTLFFPCLACLNSCWNWNPRLAGHNLPLSTVDDVAPTWRPMDPRDTSSLLSVHFVVADFFLP